MTARERRFAGLVRAALMDGAAYRPRVAPHRFEAIASAAPLEQLARVRTSPAFAARFEAEANRTGLVLDHSRKPFVRRCCLCSMEAGAHAPYCPNCGADLASDAQQAADARAREEMWEDRVRAGLHPAARFARVLEAPRLSTLPLRLSTSVSRWRGLA